MLSEKQPLGISTLRSEFKCAIYVEASFETNLQEHKRTRTALLLLNVKICSRNGRGRRASSRYTVYK